MSEKKYILPTWSEFVDDTQVKSILLTLGFNLVVASLYLLIFILMRTFCGVSARENAQKLPRRTPSYF